MPPAPKSPRSVYDLSFEDVSRVVGSQEMASKIYQQLYVERRRSSREIVLLQEAADLWEVGPLTRQGVERGSMTAKYLFGLDDGSGIESVRIKRRTGMTACVSSQVGCGFGCQFCASGRLGLQRHLTSGEIVQQVLELGHGINRVVFMGIGEPLHNYDNVLQAIRILRDRRGFGLATSGITVSTIGIPKGLKRLREEHLRINLTISLHATRDDVRHTIIPGSRSHAVDEVVERATSWAKRHNRRVTYVYLLLPGVNDSREDIRNLARWFSNEFARVNLMRWNPVEGGPAFKRVDDQSLSRTRRALESEGVSVVVRDTQGKDIDAACGQLWLRPREGRAVQLRNRGGK